MIILALIGIIILLVIALKPKKVEMIKIEPLPDNDIIKLKVFYDREIQPNEIIDVSGEPIFEIQGYNLSGERRTLDYKELIYNCACGCVKFFPEEDKVKITCTVKGNYIRSIWVKYKGITFTWKLRFL